jgi:hypothetical protein
MALILVLRGPIMVEHPIGMNMEQNIAFLERVFWHMVGIVNLVHRQGLTEAGKLMKSQEIGTAAACEFHGSKFLLTAKHVLDGAESADLAFLVRPTGRIEWANEPHRTRFERISLDIDRIVRCEWEDLAAIVLNARTCESINIQFCKLPEKLGGSLENGSVLLAGYPVDQSSLAEVVNQGSTIVHNLTARSSAFWGEIVTVNKALSGFDAESHFLIRFNPDFYGGRPHGYSGAGGWLPNAQFVNPNVWTPDPLLMGIETHGYMTSQLLRVVKSDVVRRFIEQEIDQ